MRHIGLMVKNILDLSEIGVKFEPESLRKEANPIVNLLTLFPVHGHVGV